jgi:hypothetical protein
MGNFVIGKLMGRCGNQFYQIATTYAYAKKHELEFYVSPEADNCNNSYYFTGLPTKHIARTIYHEPVNENGNSYFHEIPKIQNVYLFGYWQCFEFFNDYREELLNLFNIPYERKDGYVSIHIRRGDYIGLNKVLPLQYYKNCIDILQAIKKFKYLIFSDDIEWCKSNFNDPKIEFEFSQGKNELEDLSLMSSCEHNICANSSFSYVASWLNRNEKKLVLTPNIESMLNGYNLNIIPDNYIQVNEKVTAQNL